MGHVLSLNGLQQHLKIFCGIIPLHAILQQWAISSPCCNGYKAVAILGSVNPATQVYRLIELRIPVAIDRNSKIQIT
ncbi:hypothetical protein [Planktothrix agardhii]|uniref:hypothetical protein n=1 Tax=Planktothrix agardhii TaxID=1160 RepID=UPI0011852540|nr:hypothetical protein [Planktothrix agardhii]MCB8764127.1 hypothetical protein [Planktothrix agardhii 1809]MCF3580387.1 hypothetical protein [Planktothrix agardhii 1811]MCF3607075.1 hypothetical protein [Planktothrix agardhii 1033]MCF3620567.1 hypothetical protein [Planktothrix agardhii 1030]MCF3624962.1 hypothetical protein [Planktothrix agardhii 1801]MCF3645646.1 hypothetical protein [Planktothrix agardhii 1026]MEA5560524.1 hypothetical protein [Planktothrix agardhii UHCC 0887]